MSDVLQIWNAASQTPSKEYKSIAEGLLVVVIVMLVGCNRNLPSRDSIFPPPLSQCLSFRIGNESPAFSDTANVAPGLLAVVAFLRGVRLR